MEKGPADRADLTTRSLRGLFPDFSVVLRNSCAALRGEMT